MTEKEIQKIMHEMGDERLVKELRIGCDNNRYERMAGTPERFADTLMQIQDGTDLSLMYCCKAECRKKQDECKDFACTDERLRGCILEWLSGDEHK